MQSAGFGAGRSGKVAAMTTTSSNESHTSPAPGIIPEPPCVHDQPPRPPDPRKPIPRDPRGWRVAPAPDGRGMPEVGATGGASRRTARAVRGVRAGPAGVNWASVLLFSPAGQPRVKVPFSPYFVSQVQPGGWRRSRPRATRSRARSRRRCATRPATADATPTTLFATQVPTFWNNDQLTALLQAHDVQINAQSTTQTTSLLSRRCCSGFGPTLLIVGLSSCSCGAPPRAAAAWARSAASAARRHGGSTRRRSGSRSPTSRGSTRRSPS
jgi:hypothetical protein